MPATPRSPSPTESELKRRLADKRRKKAEREEREREEKRPEREGAAMRFCDISAGPVNDRSTHRGRDRALRRLSAAEG